MNTLRALVCVFALSSVLAAQPLVLNLAQSPAAPAGATASVELVVLNRGGEEQAFAAPATLSATLSQNGESWPVELRANPVPQDASHVAPRSFAVRVYSFVPPEGVSGIAILEAQVAGFDPVRGVVELVASTTAATAASAESPQPAAVDAQVKKPTTTLTRAEPAASIIQRTFANRLTPHEPVYFIYGPDAPAVKFQVSFKYRLLDFTRLDTHRRARSLYVAYTQRSLWDIEADSSPFYDTSYMPELQYQSLTPEPEEKDSWFTWLGYQAGFRHESNGRDGEVSRSLNTVYARPVFAFGQLDGWHLLVIPEVFTYVATLEDNPDIKDYRGYGQLRLVLGKNDGPTLLMTAWAGRDFDHETVQLDLTVPLRTKLLDFETYVLVQYFNGFGESLLSYKEESEMFRAGFSLVR